MPQRTILHSAMLAAEMDFLRSQVITQMDHSRVRIPKCQRSSRLKFGQINSSSKTDAGIFFAEVWHNHPVARADMNQLIQPESINDNEQSHVKFLRYMHLVC